MDFSPMLPLCVILVILLVLNRIRKNKDVAPRKKDNVSKFQANCSVLLPNNQVADAHLVRRGEETSVVYTEQYGRMTVPNHCLRFVGSLRDLKVKKPRM